MKIIIFTGMLIIFISVFFMLSIFDILIKANVECIRGMESIKCNIKEFGFSFMLGLSLIGMFILVDVAVIYLILKVVSASGSLY